MGKGLPFWAPLSSSSGVTWFLHLSNATPGEAVHESWGARENSSIPCVQVRISWDHTRAKMNMYISYIWDIYIYMGYIYIYLSMSFDVLV